MNNYDVSNTIEHIAKQKRTLRIIASVLCFFDKTIAEFAYISPIH